MPTVTWNSDSRNRRPIGSSTVAASANGSMCGPEAHQSLDEGGAHAVHRRRRLQRLRYVETACDTMVATSSAQAFKQLRHA